MSFLTNRLSAEGARFGSTRGDNQTAVQIYLSQNTQ